MRCGGVDSRGIAYLGCENTTRWIQRRFLCTHEGYMHVPRTFHSAAVLAEVGTERQLLHSRRSSDSALLPPCPERRPRWKPACSGTPRPRTPSNKIAEAVAGDFELQLWVLNTIGTYRAAKTNADGATLSELLVDKEKTGKIARAAAAAAVVDYDLVKSRVLRRAFCVAVWFCTKGGGRRCCWSCSSTSSPPCAATT